MGSIELDFSKLIDPDSPYCPECGHKMEQNSVTLRWWCLNNNCDVLWRYGKK